MPPVEASKFQSLPMPIAALLRRARNAKSPRDRHDTAYHAWEVAIRLAVAARPPADASALVRPSAGHWVGALSVPVGAVSDPAVLALFGHLTEAASDGRSSPRGVEPKTVLDALVAYRNKVIGHGVPLRQPTFYDDGASHLADGLTALWSQGMFLPAGARLFHVETVEEDERRRRRTRLLELGANGPEILDPAGTLDVPDVVTKGHVVVRSGDTWTTLFPWVLYRGEPGSTLFYNSCVRQPEYIDFGSGDIVRGAALDEFAPGTAVALEARLRAKRTSPAQTPASATTPAATAPPAVDGAPDALLGRTIQGQYRLVRADAGGSAGEYVATDLLLDRLVSLNVYRSDGSAQDQLRANAFLAEARALSRIEHLNLSRVLAAGIDDGLAWYALERIDAQSLQDTVSEHGSLAWDEACDSVIQACRGLQQLHDRGLVHRQVNPENLVAAGGTVRVVGFGIGAFRDREFGRGRVRGDPEFMAPEQFVGTDEDGRTDVYALGATLYFALTGQRPREGKTVWEIREAFLTSEPRSILDLRPDLPPALWTVVRRMIDRDPANRYATCNDVIAALEPIIRAAAGSAEGDPNRFGDYELLGKLGEGGMGVVYLARQTSLDRLVALKMLPPGTTADPVALARFRREVRALSRCKHANVVEILAAGTECGRAYYAMEYVEGADLAQVADALSSSGDLDAAVSRASETARTARADRLANLPRVAAPPQSAPRRDKVRALAEAMRDAARGLHHLHERGVIHRDVKPANLMLTTWDHRIVVMDLGLALLADASSSLTQDRVKVLGTLRYMSPEQLQRNLLEVDARADVYGLGATFYELFTEKRFLDGDTEARLIQQVLHEGPRTPRTANPALPRDLALIIAKCVESAPQRRYGSAAELAEDLDAWLEMRPIRVRTHHPLTTAWLFAMRHRAAVVAVAACSAAAVAATVVVVRGRGTEAPVSPSDAPAATVSKDVISGSPEVFAADGPFRVGASLWKLTAGKPMPVSLGAVVAAESVPVSIRTASGNVARLSPGSIVRDTGGRLGVDELVLERGAVTVELSRRLVVAADGWTVHCGDDAPCTVSLELSLSESGEAERENPGTPPVRATMGSELRVRAVAGWAVASLAPYDARVHPGDTVMLRRASAVELGVRTSQRNQHPVLVRKFAGRGYIEAALPRAAVVSIAGVGSDKAKVGVDVTSNQSEKVQIATTFGSKSVAAIGPGTFAVVDELGRVGGGERVPDESPVLAKSGAKTDVAVFDAAGVALMAADGTPLARVVEIDTSRLAAAGIAGYVVDNVSDRDHEDLEFTITYHFSPTPQAGPLTMNDVEATAERPLTLFRSDRRKRLDGTCPGWTPERATRLRGTTLRLVDSLPAALIARGPGPGTTLFNGRLECIAMATAGELDSPSPRLWVELENIDPRSRRASDLEAQAVFPSTGARTKWKSVPTIAPGQRARVEFDLKNVPMGDRECALKIRPQTL